MNKNLRFCFRISEKVGLAEDENGNPVEAFVCVKAKNVDSYSIPRDKYKNIQETFRKTTAVQLECDISMIKPITLNEYMDNTYDED